MNHAPTPAIIFVEVPTGTGDRGCFRKGHSGIIEQSVPMSRRGRARPPIPQPDVETLRRRVERFRGARKQEIEALREAGRQFRAAWAA
jgi:hypothetical protein